MPGNVPSPALPAGVRLPLVALTVALGVLCVIATHSAVSQQSAFSEYLTQARRCVELNDCPLRGGRTGALPLFHGASWIRLLAYSLRAGGDLVLVQSIVLVLLIVSVPVTFVFILRYLGLPAAALALGLYFPVIVVGTDITCLTYTNLLPLPLAVCYASMALFVEFRRTVFGVIAAIALAAAVSAELGSIVLVPFHILLVALTARRPAAAVVACGLAFAIPFGWESMDSAREIVRQVPTLRFAVGVAISAGIAAVVARMSPRGWLAAMPVPQRVQTVMTIALLYTTATMMLGCLLLMGAFPAPRYFLPASFPFLYLIADRLRAVAVRTTIGLGALEALPLLLLPFAPSAPAVLQVAVVAIVTLYALATLIRQIAWRGLGSLRARPLWPAVAICLCAIGLAAGGILLRSKRGTPQSFTLAEAERLVLALYAAGYTYPALLGSLQGPATDDLLPLLTERDPNAFNDAPRLLGAEDFSLLLVKVPNAAVGRARGVIAAVPIDGSRSAIIVRGERPYLDWLHMRRCQWWVEGGTPAAYRCSGPRTDQPVPHNWPYVALGDPVPILGVSPPERLQHYWSVRYELPVRTPGHGAPHIVRTANEWPATWRITRVSGVEFVGELPATEIRLSDLREATGAVELEFTGAIPGDLPWVWMPHVIEVAEENEHLLESFRNVR